MHGGAGLFVQCRRLADPKVNGPVEIAVLLVDRRVQNDVTIAVEKLKQRKIYFVQVVWCSRITCTCLLKVAHKSISA